MILLQLVTISIPLLTFPPSAASHTVGILTSPPLLINGNYVYFHIMLHKLYFKIQVAIIRVLKVYWLLDLLTEFVI